MLQRIAGLRLNRRLAAATLALPACLSLSPAGLGQCDQPLFPEPRSYPIVGGGLGADPRDVGVADLNGDGTLDLVTANYGTDDVAVLLLDEEGEVLADLRFLVSLGPDGLALSDLDGDGDIDLALTTDIGLTTLLNNGDGTFGAPLDYAVDGSLWNLEVADVNHDGADDLIMLNRYYIYKVVVALNDGSGNFDSRNTFYVYEDPVDMALGDVDGDGNLDVAVAHQEGELILILRGLGNGLFVAGGEYTQYNDRDIMIDLGDLDGDGWLDLAIAIEEHSDEAILFTRYNLGNGTFGEPVQQALSRVPREVVLSDINGDGAQDVLLPSASHSNIGVCLNDGLGGLELRHYGLGRDPQQVVPADMNRDGILDLVSLGSGLWVTLGAGGGAFDAIAHWPFESLFEELDHADMNGDGRIDIVGGYSNGDQWMSILFNEGDGKFTCSSFDPDVRFSRQILAELNGDDAPDLAFSLTDSNEIGLHFNDGTGAFGPMERLAIGSVPTSLATADVDGDSRVDLIAMTSVAGTITILRNLGDGAFAEPVEYEATTASSPFLEMGDVSGDGWPDAVVATPYLPEITLMFNNGDGTFAAPIVLTDTRGANNLLLADLNLDGVMDILSGRSHQVQVILSHGDGTFADPVRYDAANDTAILEAADLNLDGWPDLVAGMSNVKLLSVRLGLGDGAFGEEYRYATNLQPVSATAADIDGDGVTELLTSLSRNTLGVLSVACIPCPGDIDGDGVTGQSDLGLLLASYELPPGDPNFEPRADLDGDGEVGQPDLGILLADYECGA